MVRLLHEREALASTGLGNAIAVPHASSSRLRTLYGAFARSRPGVDFDAADQQPCKLFFLLLSPTAHPKLHIRALSKLSRVFSDDSTCTALLAADDSDEIHHLLTRVDAT